jgi:hypothetical protein
MTFVIVRDAHVLRSTLAVQWIAGTRPAMTVLGCVEFSPSSSLGEGVVGVARLLRASPGQAPPPGVAVLPRPPAPWLRWTREEKGNVAFDYPNQTPPTSVAVLLLFKMPRNKVEVYLYVSPSWTFIRAVTISAHADKLELRFR